MREKTVAKGKMPLYRTTSSVYLLIHFVSFHSLENNINNMNVNA